MYKVFEELNILNVSIFLTDCQTYKFLWVNKFQTFLFSHNRIIVEWKIPSEKLDINNFTFNSFINK